MLKRRLIAVVVVAAGVYGPSFPGTGWTRGANAADPLGVEGKPPRAIDKRLKIELFAEQPAIVTPTGIDVDHAGRVWAVESNTHFPPEGYQRHNSDRIWVFEDTDGDRKADKFTKFADGLTHTMSVAVRPVWLGSRESSVESREQDEGDGSKSQKVEKSEKSRVQSPAPRAGILALDSGLSSLDSENSSTQIFIATRRAIFLLHDDDGDLKADRRETLVRLETAGNYPHNGLAGFAFDALGWMYFGFGENLGADYKIIGSDGTTLSGGGEGGNIYRCRPDGSELKQWATGFWNPHASCVDAFGRLFSVDNDPDSRPPCRLLHIIPGGDYGFRFRNGRKGLHPFTAWNGEIPGTLPMVAGTGEAPSGIVAYESDGLPEEYIGDLLVTSWGDHRIDRFRLKPKGASFESLAETIVQGGEDFRPVGIAVAPDGSLYCTDWVKRDYKLHGHGRVWRISMTEEPTRKVIDAAGITAKMPVDELTRLLESPRLDVRRMAAWSFANNKDFKRLIALEGNNEATVRSRFEATWALDSPNPLTSDEDIWNALVLRRDRRRTRWLRYPDKSFRMLEQATEIGFIVDKDLTPEDMNAIFSEYRLLDDPFAFSAFVQSAIENGKLPSEELFQLLSSQDINLDRTRVALVLVARRLYPNAMSLAKCALVSAVPSPQDHQESSTETLRLAVQWVAEENLIGFRPQVEKVLDSEPMTTDLFLATLAALEMLDGVPPQDFDKTPASKYVLPLVQDGKRTPAVRAQALRLVDPNDPALKDSLFDELLAVADPALRLETVRTLQQRSGATPARLLREIAADEKNDLNLRAEAVAGLALHLQNDDEGTASKRLLLELLQGRNETLQIEALRSLRSVVTSDSSVKNAIDAFTEGVATRPGADQPSRSVPVPPLAEGVAMALGRNSHGLPSVGFDVQVSEEMLKGGDAAAGRRVFYHANSAGCYKCHTVNGRGGSIGPDLSLIARTMNRGKLADSILNPSREIAPQFTAWAFVMTSGQVHTGMLLGDTRNDVQQIGTAEGKVMELKVHEIDERTPQSKSLMPDKLVERLTTHEFRDLLAYLETLK